MKPIWYGVKSVKATATKPVSVVGNGYVQRI